MKKWIKDLNIAGQRETPTVFFISFDGSYGNVYPLESLTQNSIQVSFPKFETNLQKIKLNNISIIPQPVGLIDYQILFNKIQYHLHRGDSYLTNLTLETPIEMNIDLSELYSTVNAKYRVYYKDEWVCFSPETFIQIDQNSIKTYPMKGTIDATIPNAAYILKNDHKEVAEHHTVVDLLRNDLSHVAKEVRVNRLMYLQEIKTHTGKILQMSSEIEGKLPENWKENLGDLIATLLPAGSISGAPKDRTVEIIKTVEPHARGYYTGIAGIFDGQSVDSCVLIRFIEKSNNGFVYKSGGGITALSKLEVEYQELNQKIYVPIY